MLNVQIYIVTGSRTIAYFLTLILTQVMVDIKSSMAVDTV